MSPTIQELGIDRLSAKEKLRLIDEIWESLDIHDTPIPDSHIELLEKRLAEADANPGTGSTVEEVFARLRAGQ